jgi:hypothetical protein
MNKLMGFYELKSLNIPTVPWKLFSDDTVLDPQLLWTVRVATEAGNDLNLPRAVGVEAEEACLKGRAFAEEFKNKGIVIYYPYFIAEKSGVLDMNSERTVIEAVEKDLWNLVTYGRKDVTVIIPTDTCKALMKPYRYIQVHARTAAVAAAMPKHCVLQAMERLYSLKNSVNC